MLKFFGKKSKPAPMAPVVVDHPMYVVGDLHGKYDLLLKLLDLINADYSNRTTTANPKLLFIGDFVDRGDQSAQVLQHVMEMQTADPETILCLKGNHEKMMLDFLKDPIQKGRRWTRHGGLQTLASYNVRDITERASPEQLEDARDALIDAMPTGMLNWLKTMPTTYNNGNLICVHAGLDPSRPTTDQSENTHMWGHPDFMSKPRRDNIWVAHGHTIVDQAGLQNGRVAVDTGAYATGRLTAVGFDGSENWILQT
ncbi:MAG: metallophosphoesterase [Planktomarina sp.]